MTCQDVGLTTCCTDPSGSSPGMCEVYHPGIGNNYLPRCSCDVNCHQRNDCCADAVSIGCERKFVLHRFHSQFTIIITTGEGVGGVGGWWVVGGTMEYFHFLRQHFKDHNMIKTR